MSFLSQLINLITTPIGLVGLLFGLALLHKASQSRHVAWLLLSLFGFAASLGKFQDQYISEPPALAFPLQQLREVGRPLAIVLLGILLILGLQGRDSWRQKYLALATQFLIVVQVIIFLKTVAYGSISFAFLAMMTFSAIILMLRLGPARWLQDDQNFYWAAQSVAGVGLIFVVVNAYQAMIDPFPITFVHGLLLGTTGNPQHAAVLLAASIPCTVFLVETQSQWFWHRVFWLGVLVSIMIALFLTGSRTGSLMGLTTILFFYRQHLQRLLRIGLPALIIAAPILIWYSQYPLIGESILAAPLNKLNSGANSRQEIWLILWRSFELHPVFGVPLQGDRLLGFGESSWLGAAAALGIVGLTPLLLFGLACLHMIRQLWVQSGMSQTYFLQTSTVIAGLVSLLVGSFFEAFLLGNLSFSLLAVLIYLTLGQYLIEAAECNTITQYVETRSQSSLTQAAGAAS